MQRRSFIKLALAGATTVLTGLLPGIAAAASRLSFDHGVASGDPMEDRVVLWTRVSGATRTVRVSWRVATDPAMRDVVSKGSVRTDASRDFTVKVDADGLPAGAELYYQFRSKGQRSPVGRTRTLPTGAVGSVKLAVVSCSNYPYGYFHTYADIAKRDDLDAVLHLGDYIYEYALGGYATEHAEALGRVPEPNHEIVTLADYRTRYAQYRSDPDLQAMHGQQAFIPVWDDHEFTNDAWMHGAQNHQEGEGDWYERRDSAIQAYLEWMPIRVEAAGGDTQIYRSFRFGDLVSLMMLDTRLVGRDKQADAGSDVTPESVMEALKDPSRRLLGEKQEGWLAAELEAAQATTWQALGQQIMMMPTRAPELEPVLDLEAPAMMPRERLEGIVAASRGNPPMILDTWNGYPVAREELLGLLAAKASNPVILSGDLHTAMAGNVVPMGSDTPVAVELMTTSVNSPGFSEYMPETYPGSVRDAAMAVNPNITYMDTARKGWLLVEFTPERCSAEWNLIDNIRSPQYSVTVDKRLSVEAGKIAGGLQES